MKTISWKKFLLEIFKILTLFVNTLTANDKYSLHNRDNLKQTIQMPLFQKQKKKFFKSTLNFEHFQKKDDPHSQCISGITDFEKRG